MACLVNKFRVGRRGMSNDGNKARRFKKYRESARITGVNKNLTLRFYVILQSISSGFELNIEEFNKYTKDTGKLFVKEYTWFCMPARPQMIIWCMRFACWIPTATNAHTGCVILIAFPLQ